MGTLKLNLRGVLVDEGEVVDRLGCAAGVWTVWGGLLVIELRPLGLGKENDG